jgi:hypothetical protein
MKTKLIATLIGLLVWFPQTTQAQTNKEQPPKWVIDEWRDGKRCKNIEDDLLKIGLPVRAFSYLAWRESRCKAKVIGWNYYKGMSYQDCMTSRQHDYKNCYAVRSYDSGLMQINSSWVTVTSQVCKSEWGNLDVLRNKKCNLSVAKYLFNNGGYIHWNL